MRESLLHQQTSASNDNLKAQKEIVVYRIVVWSLIDTMQSWVFGSSQSQDTDFDSKKINLALYCYKWSNQKVYMFHLHITSVATKEFGIIFEYAMVTAWTIMDI